MMWTGAVLGLRFAECAGLTVDRLNLVAGTVTIDRQLGRDARLSVPKSAAGGRTMACPAWLVDDLAVLLSRRGLTVNDPGAFGSSPPPARLSTTRTGAEGSGCPPAERQA
jgi:hypothetical protein